MQICAAIYRFNYLAFDTDLQSFQKRISDF